MCACPGPGSCSGLFTANSMNCLSEALGMALPGNGTILAVSSERSKLANDAGRVAVGGGSTANPAPAPLSRSRQLATNCCRESMTERGTLPIAVTRPRDATLSCCAADGRDVHAPAFIASRFTHALAFVAVRLSLGFAASRPLRPASFPPPTRCRPSQVLGRSRSATRHSVSLLEPLHLPLLHGRARHESLSCRSSQRDSPVCRCSSHFDSPCGG